MSAHRIDTTSRTRKIFRAAAILLPALGLVAITWFVTLRALDTQRREAEARLGADLNNQAVNLEDQIRRQILQLDQTLRILVTVWATDPAKFNLAAWRDRAVALSDVSRDLLLADSNGIVVQSTLPDMIGTDISSRDDFAYALQHGDAADRRRPAAAGRRLRRLPRPPVTDRSCASAHRRGALAALRGWLVRRRGGGALNISGITDMFLAANSAHPSSRSLGLTTASCGPSTDGSPNPSPTQPTPIHPHYSTSPTASQSPFIHPDTSLHTPTHPHHHSPHHHTGHTKRPSHMYCIPSAQRIARALILTRNVCLAIEVINIP